MATVDRKPNKTIYTSPPDVMCVTCECVSVIIAMQRRNSVRNVLGMLQKRNRKQIQASAAFGGWSQSFSGLSKYIDVWPT